MMATYRLQLTPGFGFAEARGLVPYLADLGVSHLYLSPSFEARPGSTHGYDVMDPTRISDALGGEEGFRALSAAARDAGLGIVLDIVPNHMAAETPYSRFFDVDEETGFTRRFFDIDDLLGIRVEDPEVFETYARAGATARRRGRRRRAAHRPPRRARRPRGLPAAAARARRRAGLGGEDRRPRREAARRLPVCGTTGYEFLNDAIAVFVDPAARSG